ncbi:6-phosphogluconolactonase [Mycolicibacterium insubricum]|jgi:6-phosphogluconolactonase|uniref:6-phosphogluconolactonase n=1 Tax=Mycolicibacterium insubricum TaxID=444597 RepID=A0A1X0DFW2_9MYCO|nr:6-phosphogluconolactonase [Mycolicibacterium insubricum]ORA71072.1 6-phosphogluconolactonase [Mycolicibacterium insubricum]BBZ67001.1 6-phosphogluconolactonase [Mycolicibacterium insubricum]
MSNRPQPQVLTFADADTLVTAAADALVGEIAGAVAARGVAHVVLTGGGAGINLARRLRDRSDVDWAAVQLYWGDDRYVPAADPDRNELQARQALLDGIDIPAANVHPMPASDGQFGDNLDAAAAAYELLLSGLADGGAPTPVFDVHLLGMGGEGHVNSLFPDSPAVREAARFVVGVDDSPKPPPRRLTLTLPAVRRSRQVWLLVAGAEKADAVAAALGGAPATAVPAAGAFGTEATRWLLDAAAASALGTEIPTEPRGSRDRRDKPGGV